MNNSISAIVGIIILFLIVHSSCEFEPSLYHEVNRVEDIVPPEITINELSFTEDTIVMYWDKLLSFNFSSGKEEILAIRVLLDNQEIEVFYDSVGKVGFSHESMSPGFHNLNLEIYTTSGTGSIADQLKEEVFQFSAEWVLYVVKDHFNFTASESEGFLKLDWDDYLASDFIDYHVVMGWDNGFSSFESEYLAKGHIGEAKDYRIWARTESGRGVQFGNLRTPEEHPVIHIAKTDSSTYYLHWSKPKYFNAIEKIVIRESIWHSYFGSTSDKIVRETSDLNDTIYHIRNIQLGEKRTYFYTYYGKYPKSPLYDNPGTVTRSVKFSFLTDW